MKLVSTSETLNREVAVPSDLPRKGVTFSSTSSQSSSVTIDFTRWVDMGYPNQLVVRISRPGVETDNEFGEVPSLRQSA